VSRVNIKTANDVIDRKKRGGEEKLAFYRWGSALDFADPMRYRILQFGSILTASSKEWIDRLLERFFRYLRTSI
jgi:hypothetical protein